MCGAGKTTKSNNVQLFWNGSDQIQGAGNEVWHIKTVQHNVKKERYKSKSKM
jgi:hypothetical protein